jgi:hypothetical protein
MTRFQQRLAKYFILNICYLRVLVICTYMFCTKTPLEARHNSKTILTLLQIKTEIFVNAQLFYSSV